jgi:hypothetical protein
MELDLLTPIAAGVVLLAAVVAVRAQGVRARDRRRALEPAAPPMPVPAGRARRLAPARELAAVRPAPADLRPVRVEAEITYAEGALRLRPLGRDPGLPLDDVTLVLGVEREDLSRRSERASRTHALLCDRLAQAGWEPCGRGPAWYAHRFRRTVLLPT